MRKTTLYIFLLFAVLTVPPTVTFAQSSKAIGEAFLQTLLEVRNIHQDADSLKSYLMEKYHKDPAVLTELGRAYYRSGNTEEAGKLYDKALEVNPKFARALVGHGEILRYRVANFHQDNPEAFHDSAYYYYMKAIEAEPANQVAYDSMMVLLADNRERYYKKHTHEDSLKAAETYETSIALLKRLKQNDPTAFIEPDMARIYMQMGKPSMAIEQYLPVLDKLNSAQYFNYCMCLYSVDKYDETIDASNFGFEKYPDYRDFCRPIFYSQAEKKQYIEAVETYREVLRLEKQYARDHTIAMDCYLYLDNIAEATRAANRIYDTDDENTFKAVSLSARKIIGKAKEYEKFSEFDKAINAYRTYYEEKDYGKIMVYYTNKTQSTKTEKDLRAADLYNLTMAYYSKAKEEFNDLGQPKSVDVMIDESRECERVFNEFSEKNPDYKAENVCFAMADIWRNIDIKEEYRNGRALPYFSKLITLTEGKEVNGVHVILSNAYHYMAIYYYFVTKDFAKGIAYAKKFKNMNPDSSDLDGIINTKVPSGRRR